MDKAVIFGKHDHLLGVSNIVENSEPVAMLFLNAGMLHSVGPQRMYVELANHLAKKNISSLRFDLSGIGESLAIGTPGKSIDRAAMETTEAMDYMAEHHNIENFILFGLCSGADDSIQTALKDKRVKGVIALDGLGYKTKRFKFNQALLFSRKLLNIQLILRKLKNIISRRPVPKSLAMGVDVREFPDKPEQACHELQQLIDRNTKLHFIYTGGTDYYNYSNQFYDMLSNVNWNGNESTCYFSHMDHVVMLCEDRQELIDHVVDKALTMVAA